MKVHDDFPSYVSDQSEFFDRLVSEDPDFYIDNHAWDHARRFETAQLMRCVQPRRILDIGCGCGFHDVVMAEYPWVDSVDGIDYSANSIELGRQHYPHPKVRRWKGDFRALSPEAPYDLAVSFQVFEHLDCPDDYLDACRRLVCPGGHIAIVTPNRLGLHNRLRRLAGEPPVMIDTQHFREYDVSELKALGRSHGFEVERTFARGLSAPQWPFLRRLPHPWTERLGSILSPAAFIIGVVFRTQNP